MRQNILTPNWLRFLIVVLLVMSVLFRFSNINGKVYSHDETYTSLRISGYTVKEVKQQIFTGQVITSDNFSQFQGINQQKKLGDTIMSLVKEDPQRTPLYFVIARFWVALLGNSVIAIRSLSVCISFLILPGIYWLCRELFSVPLSLPGLAIALTIISPIYLVYSQEAQEYILWLVTIIFCSASLIRAIRLEFQYHDQPATRQQQPDRFSAWGIYALSLAVSLYTCLWSVFVAIAHGIYVIKTANFQLTPTARAYLLSSVFAFVTFLPWCIIIIADFFQFLLSAVSTNLQFPLQSLLPFLLIQLSRFFLDIDLALDKNLMYVVWAVFVILAGCAIYFIYKTTSQIIWLFILTLIVVPALPLMLLGLVVGGIQLGAEAYLIPSYLGIQIAVIYLLATQISQRIIWRTIMALLIICGLVSSRVYYQADTWWSKGVSYNNPQVAQIINQAANPLVISDAVGTNYGNIFSLSYLVQPRVRFKLLKNQMIPTITNQYTDIFLFNMADAQRQQIAARYQSKVILVYRNEHYSLWKLIKPKKL